MYTDEELRAIGGLMGPTLIHTMQTQLAEVAEDPNPIREYFQKEFDTLLELFPHLVVLSRRSYELCVEGENRMPVYIGIEDHPRFKNSFMCTGKIPGVPMKVYGHGMFEYAVDI